MYTSCGFCIVRVDTTLNISVVHTCDAIANDVHTSNANAKRKRKDGKIRKRSLSLFLRWRTRLTYLLCVSRCSGSHVWNANASVNANARKWFFYKYSCICACGFLCISVTVGHTCISLPLCWHLRRTFEPGYYVQPARDEWIKEGSEGGIL